MQNCIRGGTSSRGGAVSYLTDKVYREIAYIAYHFNWSRNEIMSMSHHERLKWVKEISSINGKINSSMIKTAENNTE